MARTARKGARVSTPISTTGSRAARSARSIVAQAGFTIVELMVVITIIGLASAAVVLAMPDPRGRLDNDAARFAARVRAAHDLAIVEGRSISVWVTDVGYGFDLRAAEGWSPIAERPFRVARWQEGIRPSISSPDGRARVIFDSTGLSNVPMELELNRGDERAHVSIGNDGSVVVHG
ncbi:MAG: GspH/FimT family pseudopilin [Sphingomonas sp.]|nr:GspH/FimT family pseudopilin [Sphingomonas sp.]